MKSDIYLDLFVSMVSYRNFSLFVSLGWAAAAVVVAATDTMKLSLLYVVMKYCYYCIRQYL